MRYDGCIAAAAVYTCDVSSRRKCDAICPLGGASLFSEPYVVFVNEYRFERFFLCYFVYDCEADWLQPDFVHKNTYTILRLRPNKFML